MYNKIRVCRGLRRLCSLLLCLGFLGSLVACETTKEPKPEPRQEPTPVVVSKKSRVRFKGNLRLVNTLSQSLGLEKDKLCKELGLYDCFKEVHSIVLGGVEPYRLSIRESWKLPPVIAPIAVDRIALASCAERVKRDFADASKAIIFAALAANPTGEKKSLEEAVTQLYKRLLLRVPNEQETALLIGFWEQVKGKSQTPAQDWAQLACFGVVTSSEFLFY